jgi:hypothetical protein
MPLLAALLAVGVLVLILTALTRLFCEAGLFFMQVNEFPSRLVMQALPPAALGPGPLVQLNVWNRAMMSDWFRVAFMPVMMNSLHLAARTGLTKRGAMAGMMGAVALALGVSFFSVLYTAYTRPGGANTMAHYYFNDFPHGEYATLTRQVRQIESYQRKLAETGGKLKPEEVPDVARRDRVLIAAEGVGAGYLALTLWLRSFVFWWPHPIGYVMWMANWPHYNTWFAFFVGWCLKKAILKYGGSRVYLRAKRFFIGLVVGEALGVIFWKIVAVWTNTYSDFSMLPT